MRSLRIVSLLMCMLVLIFVYSLRTFDSASTPEPVVTVRHQEKGNWRQLIEKNFAFDEVCQECHQEQFTAHQRSGHSHTATPMELSALAQTLRGTTYHDPARSQEFMFDITDELFHVRDAASAPFPVHWLLGSGTHAQTPVSVDPVSGYGVEFRWSWIAHQQTLGLTPDHERFDDYRSRSLECYGRPLEPQQALACLTCHMTAVPPQGVAPTREQFFPNVTCERCHGPRKEHVRLAKLGRAAEVKPLITYDDPTAYLKHCAQCHRDESNVPADSTPATLARYQPYGLQKSACYLNSSGMTCSTCHDPHDRTSTDRSAYVAICMTCHSAQEQRQCYTNPTGDCIQCHMPEVEWEQGITFHDHWIRKHEVSP